MALVQAFNTLLAQFVGELSKALPNNASVKTYRNTVALLLKSSPSTTLLLTGFRDWLGDAASKIDEKDQKLFEQRPLFMGNVDLASMWKTHITHVNKNVIWTYLHGLLHISRQIGDSLSTTATDSLLNQLAHAAQNNPNQLHSAIKRTDSNDFLKLISHIPPEEILAVLPVSDPMELLTLVKGGINPAEIMDLLSNFDEQKLAALTTRIDHDKLLELVSKVDQDKLNNLLAKIDRKQVLQMVQGILHK